MKEIKTIDELLEFIHDKGIPVEQMRFAIGENMGSQPRWFFIYYDIETQEWVVAKNKDTGETVERYRGDSEEKAVEIIFAKMEEEANKRGLSVVYDNPAKEREEYYTNRHNDPSPDKRKYRRKRNSILNNKRFVIQLSVALTIVIAATIFVAVLMFGPTRQWTGPGYYKGYNGNVYCNTYEDYRDRYRTNYSHAYDGYHDRYYYDDYDYDYNYRYDNDYDYDYNYDYDYDYDDDYDYDYSYDYDDDSSSSWSSWDSSDTDWGSSWDSYDSYDYDSGSSWDSWDSGSTDWDSDW